MGADEKAAAAYHPFPMNDGQRIAAVLGIDPYRVKADSMRLTPFGPNWIVEWEGIAVLYGEAAQQLFGATNLENRSQ